eukprot:TRINITY_DN396_c0_g1_i1.p1 TRINITY_DN396_c0_g1~~TRINITY_DN396_c0_g1_i1.p1  ORF type:complete len:494 (+),score=120.93 TRINITY_DN396_c0_g1_i1:438-1919(+)
MAVIANGASESQGRITVFSTSGCPHCRAAKSLLKKKGASYVEINLDVYPERRMEMEQLTKKSSTPEIFFNDEFIGGNDSLQELEKAGKLDAKLQVVYTTPAPPSAPAPPAAVAPSGGSPADALPLVLDEHAALMDRMHQAIAVKDHLFNLVNYHKDCFTGAEVVTFLAKDGGISREEALKLGEKLVMKHYFRNIFKKEDMLVDGPDLYRFLEHDTKLKSPGMSLNFLGAVSQLQPPPATLIGEKLRKLILAIYEEFLSEDGRQVDYKGIAKSEVFRRYVTKTQELQRVDLTSLSREEKLAFFINIYNALVVHATVDAGSGPENAVQRKTFFNGYAYVMGGLPYTLSDIENGVLRGNRRAPYTLFVPFPAKDDRLKVALKEPEPLIHFALVCGAKSCPPIKTYRPVDIKETLRASARSFFESGGIEIDAENNTVSLSKILYWYHVDFGATDAEMLKWVVQFLDEERASKLESLLKSDKLKVTYQPYDWTANSKH